MSDWPSTSTRSIRPAGCTLGGAGEDHRRDAGSIVGDRLPRGGRGLDLGFAESPARDVGENYDTFARYLRRGVVVIAFDNYPTGGLTMRNCFLALLLVTLALSFSATAAADNYRTQSGKVLCWIQPDGPTSRFDPNFAVCQGKFQDGNFVAVTTGDGSFHWENGNNIAINNPTTQMVYGQTYRHGNWTIYNDQNGTRLTNNRTGHGMFVSIENVRAF